MRKPSRNSLITSMKFGISFLDQYWPAFISICSWHSKIALLINRNEIVDNKVNYFSIFMHFKTIYTFRNHHRLGKNLFDSIGLFCNCTKNTLKPAVSKTLLLDVIWSHIVSEKLKLAFLWIIQATNSSDSFPLKLPKSSLIPCIIIWHVFLLD